MPGTLAILDDDGNEVVLDADEAAALMAMTDCLDAATVSACPTCRSRVLASVAVVDVLDEAPPHPRAGELAELAEEAPTLHLYLEDLADECRHERWRDPGHTEWVEALADFAPERPVR
jgi:hypothetical protein